MSTVNVDQKLGLNKFIVDEENAHIVLKAEPDRQELRKLVLACPAGLYKIDENGTIQFDYAGCIECGTCRVLCGHTILEKWEFPLGTLGVAFRWG
ncbi:ferredoxin family protein [Sporomusa sp.]|uniref:ferredoxin family protein n=1 Tax=Sporomusa sp. TaxID=2078658 RepID=UPI002BB65702|nr:ferredoxin family protein [Sporomusa sp.]HWR06811.1 ferredoxin family protein [Sporomusa sp.]